MAESSLNLCAILSAMNQHDEALKSIRKAVNTLEIKSDN
jgi:hypothetical protein